MPRSSASSKVQVQVRKITVLYTDLRAFTEFNSGLRPRQLANLMNTYYTDAATIIRNAGGTVDKFIGDSVLAHFNSAKSVKQPELRAVEAASGIKAKVAERWPDLPISIGIATGRAVTGYFGPAFHRAYTAFGDVVTRAVVLERRSHFTGFKIIVDGETRNKLGAKVPVDDHPAFDDPLVKGMKVFEIGFRAPAAERASNRRAATRRAA